MNEATEEAAPRLALPRPRLVPCRCPPMVVEVTSKAVTVTHEQLAAHAGRADVAGVLCVSSTFATAETGGSRMPDLTRLYTREPELLEMWPGDALRLSAAKPGRVMLVAMSN